MDILEDGNEDKSWSRMLIFITVFIPHSGTILMLKKYGLQSGNKAEENFKSFLENGKYGY